MRALATSYLGTTLPALTLHYTQYAKKRTTGGSAGATVNTTL